MKKSRTFSIRTALTLLGAMFLCQQALAQDKHIDVSVQQEGGVYKLKFLNSECPDNPNQMGCIRAEHGSSPNISWELVGIGDDEWVFTRLRFSPDGVHWGDSAHPLDNCTVEDFELQPADAASGWASSAKVLANGKRLQIKDRNRNVCTTHYRLFAAPKAGGAEIDSDPVIDNRGGGRN